MRNLKKGREDFHPKSLFTTFRLLPRSNPFFFVFPLPSHLGMSAPPCLFPLDRLEVCLNEDPFLSFILFSAQQQPPFPSPLGAPSHTRRHPLFPFFPPSYSRKGTLTINFPLYGPNRESIFPLPSPPTIEAGAPPFFPSKKVEEHSSLQWIGARVPPPPP